MSRWLFAALLSTLVACSGVASAQTANPSAPRPYVTLAKRFETANTTHDGHLTLEQAKQGMPAIARHFDEIDTAHHGWLTYDQVRQYAYAWRAAHPDGNEGTTAAK